MDSRERELIEQATGILASCIAQRAPSDDKIIADNISSAYEVLKDAMVVTDPQQHVHRAGPAGRIDECALCSRDIREHAGASPLNPDR